MSSESNNSATMLRLKRAAKTAVLASLIASRRLLPERLAASALGMIRIGFAPDKPDAEGPISVSRYRGGALAACCITVDFDHPSKEPWKTALNREGTLELLALSERYNVPLTWAICGKAALAEPEAYGRILQSKTAQDIGVHTFNHRDFSDPACSDEEAQLEITRCIQVLGLPRRPTTFVFPWNREDKFHIVTMCGFTAYRGKDRCLGYPAKQHGLWNIPPLYYLDEKSFGAQSLVRRFIDLAIAYGCVCHLWAHPWSLSANGDVGLYCRRTLEPIFEYLAGLRDEGVLWLCTMKDLANYCEAREHCTISRGPDGLEPTFYVTPHTSDPPDDSPTILTIRFRREGPTPADVRRGSGAKGGMSRSGGDGWLYVDLPAREGDYSVAGGPAVRPTSRSHLVSE